jgi:multiple sugar transport system permease protein/putative aldouronate transport system permease protein
VVKEPAMQKYKKVSPGDRIFGVFNFAFLFSAFILVLYPIIFVVSSSLSSPQAIITGRVFFWPVNFSFEGYRAVFRSSQVWTGYSNSLYYTTFGTLINVVVTVMAAYPLSRKDLIGRNKIMLLFTFTMFFSGGMIPTFLLVRGIGILNTRWAMLLPGAISVWNMILTRTYFQNSIPNELLESAQLDGCRNTQFIWHIVLPLSKAIIAVISLYYAIGHWNAFFSALIYLNNFRLYPLQIILRNILVQNQIDNSMINVEEMMEKEQLAALLKYSLIIVASLPMMVAYPFAQKYFVKGVMIGSIKG